MPPTGVRPADACLDASPDPFYACDREGRLLRANAAFVELVGASGDAASLAGRLLAEVAPHLAPRFAVAHEVVLRSGEPLRGIESFPGPGPVARKLDVVRYPVAERPRRRPTIVAGHMREAVVGDVGLEEARRAARRGREFVDSNMLPLVFWHLDGRITEANDAFLALVGYTRADLEAGRVRWRPR